MPWPQIRWSLASLLCLSVLAGNVYTRFVPVREKLVKAPRPGGTGISVRLDNLEAPGDAQLVLVCVVRNDGTSRLDLSVEASGRVLKRVGIRPGARARIDAAWARPQPMPQPYQVTLTGSEPTWTLQSLEVANLHGFTRGVVEALVLPAAQRFGRPSPWWLAAFAACAVLLAAARPPRRPRWIDWPWRLLAALVTVVLAAVVASPLVSPFRVVVSPGTLAAGAMVLAVPRTWEIGRRVGAALNPVAARIGPRLAAVPWLPAFTAVAASAYLVFLALHVGAYAGGSDQSGYMNSARLLGLGRVTVPMRVAAGIPPADLPPLAYVPLGFRPHGIDEMSPTYPIGLPLAVLATAQVTGWTLAPHATMVWHALLGVGLMYWLGRVAGLSRGLSTVGAMLLATSPLYLFSSTTLMSDTPALVWTTASVLLAWRSRDHDRVAVLAGAAVSMAVLVRPTNILVLAPVAACLGLSVRRWAWLCAGGAPGAALLLSYNAAAYGSPLVSGYGDVSSAFAWANVPASLRAYAEWLPVELTPLVVLALGLPVLRSRSLRLLVVLALWIVSVCGVYAFYYNTHEAWWYLRFILPAFPAIGTAALLVGRELPGVLPVVLRPTGNRALSVASLAVGVLVLVNNVFWVKRLEAASAGHGERAYYEAATWVRTHLPAGSALLAMQASGALFHYTDLPLLRWDMLPRERFEAVAAALEARRQPLYAVLFPFEVDEDRVLTERAPGTWTRVGTVRHVTIWRFDGPPRGPGSRFVAGRG